MINSIPIERYTCPYLEQIRSIGAAKNKSKVFENSFIPRYSRKQFRKIKRLKIDNKKRVQYYKAYLKELSTEKRNLKFPIQKNFNSYSFFLQDEKFGKIYSSKLSITNNAIVKKPHLRILSFCQEVIEDGNN